MMYFILISLIVLTLFVARLYIADLFLKEEEDEQDKAERHRFYVQLLNRERKNKNTLR